MRIATDCSGLACAEVSLQTLAKEQGGDVRTVFACDVWSGSQKWLRDIGIKPVLKDMNMRVWSNEASKITTRDLAGQAVTLRAQDCDIDIYVCGFMCTPFTPNGQRKEWADEHAKTFFSAVKTVAALRPRVAILENVMAISNNANSDVVKRELATLEGYVVLYLKLNSSDFGIPHHRPRVYMVALRKDDALRDIFKNKPQALLERFLMKQISKCQEPCGMDFDVWLADMGCPIVKSMASVMSASVAATCTCHLGPRALCDVHPCKCQQCTEQGVKACKCKWRRTHRLHLQSGPSVVKRRDFLKLGSEIMRHEKPELMEGEGN